MIWTLVGVDGRLDHARDRALQQSDERLLGATAKVRRDRGSKRSRPRRPGRQQRTG